MPGKQRVLIIDDEPDIVETVKIRLTISGYAVIAESDSRQGVALAEKENPDLILLDISMPGMDGLQVLDKLKNNPQTKHIPVVMLTCSSQGLDIKRSTDLGAVDYVVKPFDSRVILEKIHKHIHRK
ncbi:MAG: response regulator [Candidatus Omnitrophota bacterium]